MNADLKRESSGEISPRLMAAPCMEDPSGAKFIAKPSRQEESFDMPQSRDTSSTILKY